MKSTAQSAHMFSEQTFVVKHLNVIPLREAANMRSSHPAPGSSYPHKVHHRECLHSVPASFAGTYAQSINPPGVPSRSLERLPQSVYRRRRLMVALVAASVLVLALLLGRPDRVPYGEVEAWPVPDGAESVEVVSP